MKKLFFLFVVSLLVYTTTNAQAIQTGDQAINIGIGFGSSLVDRDHTGLPSINVSYEFLPFEKLGIGYIGLGGYAGYKHSNYDYGTYEYKYNHWIFGVRGAYHFDFYDMNGIDFFNQFDVYAGVFAGFMIDNDDWNDDLSDPDYGLSFRNDLFAGARYNFIENIGVFTEVGYGINYFVFGIDFLF
jgi:hypothetical protein